MKNRREFFKSIAAAGVLGAVKGSAAESMAKTLASPGGGLDDRAYWISVMEKLAGPVLGSLSRCELKNKMAVETTGSAADRRRFSHLEAFGRLLAGMAPWLGVSGLAPTESKLQSQWLRLAHDSLDAATNPHSPDYMNFVDGGQPLVDTAFLAQAILRAPHVLWEPLDPRVRRQIVSALKSSRAFPTPTGSNWVLFAAMIEAALLELGETTVEERLESCLRQMLRWYKGDGFYGDGEWFHFDYYNSFVIHPMLLDTLAVLRRRDPRFEPVYATVLMRSQRYAATQERLIAPDGTFPPVGRSITYRFGALQLLALIAWMRKLPEPVSPAQVRCALTAVIRRMIEAPGTFDDHGWLRIGFCGHQPSLGEPYISTGSLYLCSTGLLPLGLPPTDPFWSDPPMRWTSQQLWSGAALPADHAIRESMSVDIPKL